MRHRQVLLIFLCGVLTTALAAQCAQDHRTNKKAGIVVNDLSVEGTTTLTSAELAGITAAFTGSCFDDDSDEMGQRLRMLFQNRDTLPSR